MISASHSQKAIKTRSTQGAAKTARQTNTRVNSPNNGGSSDITSPSQYMTHADEEQGRVIKIDRIANSYFPARQAKAYASANNSSLASPNSFNASKKHPSVKISKPRRNSPGSVVNPSS